MKNGSEETKAASMYAFAKHGDHADLPTVMWAKGILGRSFFANIRHAFFDSDYWDVLVEAERTHAASSVAFTIMARLVVGWHFSFYTREHTYPFKLWRLLENDLLLLNDVVTSIKEDCWHMLDPFARAFITVYKGVMLTGLKSTSCRMALLALALTLRHDTYQLENRFGWMRRFKGLVTATLEQELETISSHFFNTRCRVIQNGIFGKNKKPSPTPSGDPAEDSASQDRHGGGGPWRAFVSDMLGRHYTKSPDKWRRMAEMYRLMKSRGGAENDGYAEKGRLAARAHALGGQSFAANVSFSKMPQLAVPVLQALRGDRVASTEADALVEYDVGTSSALVQHEEELARISKEARELNSAANVEEEARRQVVAEWSSNATHSTISSVYSRIPYPVTPEPRGGVIKSAHSQASGSTPKYDVLRTCELNMPLFDFARQVIHRCDANMYAELRKDWVEKHRLLIAAECQKIPPPLKRESKRAICRTVGMCVCNKPLLVRFATAYKRRVRKAVAPEGELRKVYDSGALVWQFSQTSNDDLWCAMPVANLITLNTSLMRLTPIDESDAVGRMERDSGYFPVRMFEEDELLGCKILYAMLDLLDHARPCQLRAWSVTSDTTLVPFRKLMPGTVVLEHQAWSSNFWLGPDDDDQRRQFKLRRRTLRRKRARPSASFGSTHSGGVVRPIALPGPERPPVSEDSS